MADWAGLHLDILVSILKKIIFIEDFVAFGSVCRSWRGVVRRNQHYLRPQIPWLMLANREHCRQSKDYVSVKNLYIPEMVGRKCIGLNYGWVLRISRNGEMDLVHPRSRIRLPNGNPYFFGNPCAALSANPSQTSNFVVMIVCDATAFYLGYGGLGDQQWTSFPIKMPHHINGLLYCQDRFYGVDAEGGVWGFSVSDPLDCLGVTDRNSIFPCLFYRKKYIVVSEGDLLVVCCSSEWPRKFQVYKVDLINGKYTQIMSLGDRSIFVGHSTSISVDVSEFRGGGGTVKSNHIYFADIVWGCYSLEDEQFKKFEVQRAFSDSTFWFVPYIC